MKKEIFLNQIEKKRNQFSSEFFSKGASQQLKEAFKNNSSSKFNSFLNKIKKDKEDQEKKIQHKLDKTKRENFGLKMGIKAKIFTFGVLSISAVVMFRSLNDLFEERKDDVKKVIKQQEIINNSFNFDDEKIKEVNEKVDQFNDKLNKNIWEHYATPLLCSIDWFLNLKNKMTSGECAPTNIKGLSKDMINLLHSSDYYQKYKQNLKEGQKEKGIIGHYLDTIATTAFIHLIQKRGYGFILSYLDIKSPEFEGIDMTMWKHLSQDKRMYPHLGRNIGSPSRLGDVLMSQIQDKNSILKHEVGEAMIKTVNETAKNVSNFEYFFQGNRDEKALETSYEFQNLDKYLKEALGAFDEHLISLTKGRYKKPKIVNLEKSLVKWTTVQQHTEIMIDGKKYKLDMGGAIYRQKQLDVAYIVIEKEKGDLIGGELGFKNLPKIRQAAINGYDKIVNTGVDYLNEMYPNYRYDKRVMDVLNVGIQWIINFYNAQSIINFQEIHTVENNVTDTYNLQKTFGAGTWKLGGALMLMQLVKVVAEWELYQSFVAARTMDALYNDFINNGVADKIELSAQKYYEEKQQEAEQWMIEYARGRKTLDDFIKDYITAFGKMIYEHPNFKVKRIKLKSGKTQIKITNNFKNFKPLFQGLKDKIRISLNTEMKKIKYGNIKGRVKDIGKKFTEIQLKRLNSKNVLVLNNNSLRENFNTARVMNTDLYRNNSGKKDDFYSLIVDVPGNQIEKTFVQGESFMYKNMPDCLADKDYKWKVQEKLAGAQILYKKFSDGGWETFKEYGVRWYYSRDIPVYSLTDRNGNIYDEYYDSGKPKNKFWFFPGEIKEDYVIFSSIRKMYEYSEKHIYYDGRTVEKTNILYEYTADDQYIPYRYKVLTYQAESVHFDEKTNKYSYTWDTIREVYLIDTSKYNLDANDSKNWIPFRTFVSSSVPSEKSHAAIYNGKYDETTLKDLYNTPVEGILTSLIKIVDKSEEELETLWNTRKKLINEILSNDTKSNNWDEKEGSLLLHVVV